jgi:hypothetical protein
MKKEAIILGTNKEGFKEGGKILGKFLLFCLFLSICLMIYSYIKILGIIIFIVGLILIFKFKKRLKKI